MNGYIPNNTVNTPKTYQQTLKHKLSLAYDGVLGTGTVCKHIELDSTYTLMAYEDDNSDIGVILGTKDGVACITWGTSTVLTGTYTLEDFIGLNTTSALLIMRESGGNISTAVISFTAPSTIVINAAVNSTLDAVTTSIKGCLIDTNKVIVAYKSTSDSRPYVAVCSISGTTPSYGSATNAKAVQATNPTSISVCKITSTTFLMTYDDSVSTNCRARILTFDGNVTITVVGAESAFMPTRNTFVSCGLLDSTHIIIGFNDITAGNYDTAIIGIISGTTISSWGTKVAGQGLNQIGQIVVLSSTKFGYIVTNSSDKSCWAIVGNISSGTTITFGLAVNFSTTTFGSNGVKIGMVRFVDSTHISFCFLDTHASWRRLCYGVVTTYGLATVVFNEMTQKLVLCGTGKEIFLSLMTLVTSSPSYNSTLYLNGNEITNKLLRLSTVAANEIHATAFGEGILQLPNCPISLVAGQSLYVGCNIDSMSQTIVVTGMGDQKTL